MQFNINGNEYKLVFHHSNFKQHQPTRFGAPAGLTSCSIYWKGRDGEGKPTWHLKYHATVIQYGSYNYQLGRKRALADALCRTGWAKPLRTIAWKSYLNRSCISMAPTTMVRASSISTALISGAVKVAA